MKFIVSLIAVYVYFTFALLDSFKNFSYYTAEVATGLVVKKAEPNKIKLAEAVVSKAVSPTEKTSFSL